MTLLILSVLAYLVWRRLRPHFQTDKDGLGSIIGTATEYGECAACGQTNCQTARGRGEVITRGGHYLVRQYHICQNCNARALWHRRLDQFVWTMHRSGVQG